MAKSFGKIKKELENKWIADSIKGKVKYQLTKYRKSHDSRYGRVTIILNDQTILNSSDLERVFAHGFMNHNQTEALNAGMIDTLSFYSSYEEYTNQSIEKSIASKNPLIRLFALFDKRIGKRRYKELKNSFILEAQWLTIFYDFRYNYEYNLDSLSSAADN